MTNFPLLSALKKEIKERRRDDGDDKSGCIVLEADDHETDNYSTYLHLQ
jgi:hypothetical protein